MCSKSGSRRLHILPPNAIKEGFSKNPLFKLCVLSSTWLHLVYPSIKLRKISDGRTDGRTNGRTFNYLAQTSKGASRKNIKYDPPACSDHVISNPFCQVAQNWILVPSLKKHSYIIIIMSSFV